MRSCLICGSETRPIKVEREVNLGRTEINMIRCVFTLREMKKIVEYRELLRWEPVSCSHLYFTPITFLDSDLYSNCICFVIFTAILYICCDRESGPECIESDDYEGDGCVYHLWCVSCR